MKRGLKDASVRRLRRAGHGVEETSPMKRGLKVDISGIGHVRRWQLKRLPR